MRHIEPIPLLIAGVLLSLAWTGCGPAGAQNEATGAQAATATNGSSDSRESGLLARFFEPAKVSVEVPAGTLLVFDLQNTLSSHETPVGASFTGTVTQEVSVGGRVAVPVGSIIRGRVVEARPAKKIGGRPILALAFDKIDPPKGESVPIAAQLVRLGRSEAAKDAAIIGGSTIGGAILGEAVHEGEGTTVGAILGGIAGTVGALKTSGKPVVLPAGTSLHIALERPVTVEVRS